MNRGGSSSRGAQIAAVVGLLAGGCDEGGGATTGLDAAVDAVGGLACPDTWVATASGGCGPAVLLCAAEGGAAPGACAGFVRERPEPVRDPDGEESVGLYLRADGSVGGAWSARPWPCPSGWTQTGEGACAPTLRNDCPLGARPLPDGTCTGTGVDRCTAAFAEVPAEAAGARAVYVRMGADRRPDGTADAPYGTLLEALAAEPTARWFLLGAGRYEIDEEVTRELHLVGACAAQVSLVRHAAPHALLSVARPDAPLDLRDLTLPSADVGITVRAGASLSLTRVHMTPSHEATLDARGGARITLRDSFIEGTTDTRAAAVAALEGAQLVMERTHLDANAQQGVVVGDGATATFTQSVVRRFSWRGISTDAGSRATLREVAVYEGVQSGVVVSGQAEASFLSVQGLSSSTQSLTEHKAIGVDYGGHLVARHVLVRDVTNNALRVRKLGTVADFEDLVVVNVSPILGRGGGEALYADEHPRVRLRRAVLRRSANAGIFVSQDAELDLRDALVDDVAGDVQGRGGIGIGVFGGSVTGRRVVVRDARAMGLLAIGLPPRIVALFPDPARAFGGPPNLHGRVAMTDLLVRDTHPSDRDNPAAGLFLAATARFDGTRVAVQSAHGVSVSTTTTGFSTDLLLASLVDNMSLPASLAPVLRASLGPSLDEPSSASVRDLYVRGPERWAITSATTQRPRLADDVVAFGLYAGADTTLDVDGVTLDGASRGDIGAASFGALSLRRGVVAGFSRCALARSRSVLGAAIRSEAVRLSGNGVDGACVTDALPSLFFVTSPN